METAATRALHNHQGRILRAPDNRGSMRHRNLSGRLYEQADILGQVENKTGRFGFLFRPLHHAAILACARLSQQVVAMGRPCSRRASAK